MESKIALITGATSGIGAAFAKKYASLGYDLIITGRRIEKINALAKQLTENYRIKVDVRILELSNMVEVESFINSIKQQNVEVLMNNAGFATSGKFYEEEFIKQNNMINVHILASVKLIYSIVPNMIKRGKGHIINISSLSAFLPMPKNAMYSATKSFLKTFSEAIYLELFDKGVKVQALCPGFIRSDFHEKMGIDKSRLKDKGIIKWMMAEEVVEKSLKCLDKGKAVCIPGFWNKILSTLPTILPTSIYYRIARNGI